MHKQKESLRDILISSSARGKAEPYSKEDQFTKQRTKTIHPPIETLWHLPPPKEDTRFNKSVFLNPSKMLRTLTKIRKSQSMRMAFEGSHDPKDQLAVDAFRELLFVEGPFPVKHYDYHTLLRFLRMRDFDLVKSKEMFLNYVKWRKEYGVDDIPKQFKFEEYAEVKRCYPHGFHGVDRYGRPIYIEQIGLIDVVALFQVTTIERFVKYHITEQEKTLNWRYPACSLSAKKHIASTTSILDVKDVGISNFSKPARYLFLEIQKIDSNYYPETLHRLFIVNAGSGFKVLWKAIKQFLDSRTLAKIQVLGSNFQNKLFEVIDPSNLPSFLGGSCTCSDYGGCLSSDKGPWNDPEITEMLQVMLETGVESEDDKRHIDDGISNDPSKDLKGNGETKDIHDVSPMADTSFGEKGVINQSLLPKIDIFEISLRDVKAKMQAIEAALQEIKLVLRGLARQIEELKKPINIR